MPGRRLNAGIRSLRRRVRDMASLTKRNGTSGAGATAAIHDQQ
jgi:predicted sugar kinase